jgi:hypothetical protein
MMARVGLMACIFFSALLCNGLALAVSPPSAPIEAAGPKLLRFKAFLFNRDTGAFSSDVLARDDKAARIELLNVVSGEMASDATFVSLEIQAPANDILPAGTRVRLKALDSGRLPFAANKQPARPKVLIDRVVQTRRAGASARTFIGFWLPSTGCSQIKLSAEFVDLKQAGKLADSIDFVCHE